MTETAPAADATPALRWPEWRHWRYDGGKRDLRFDLIRGFAVFAMITDHIGGAHSWLYLLTGANSFFVSAAEFFVFISGVVFGIVEARIIPRAGVEGALTKALKRVAVLYGLTVALTLAFMLVSTWLRTPWAPVVPQDDASEFVVGVLTLHRTFFLADVLLMYVLLIGAAGPALILLERGLTWLVLAGSWTLWLLWQIWPEAVRVPWEIADNKVFQFPAWQVIFFTGLAIGFHRKALAERLARLPLRWVALVSGMLMLGFIALYAVGLAPVTALTPWDDFASAFAALFGKEDLRPGRIVVFGCLMTFIYTFVTLLWGPVLRLFGWLLLPFGQHALGAYMIHIFFVALGTKLLPSYLGPTASHDAPVTTVLQLVVLFAVWGLIKLREPLGALKESLTQRQSLFREA